MVLPPRLRVASPLAAPGGAGTLVLQRTAARPLGAGGTCDAGEGIATSLDTRGSAIAAVGVGRTTRSFCTRAQALAVVEGKAVANLLVTAAVLDVGAATRHKDGALLRRPRTYTSGGRRGRPSREVAGSCHRRKGRQVLPGFPAATATHVRRTPATFGFPVTGKRTADSQRLLGGPLAAAGSGAVGAPGRTAREVGPIGTGFATCGFSRSGRNTRATSSRVGAGKVLARLAADTIAWLLRIAGVLPSARRSTGPTSLRGITSTVGAAALVLGISFSTVVPSYGACARTISAREDRTAVAT